MTEGGTEALALQQYVTELETQLADTTRQHNEEIRNLSNEVACLQSQLEQGETDRQTLTFDLTVAQKEIRQSNLLLAEKEKQWDSIQSSMQGELSKLSQQCQDWNNTLETVQEARAQERVQSQELLAAKENQLSVRMTQCEDLLAVKKQLENEIDEDKRTIHDLHARLQQAQEDIERKRDTIQRQSHDLKDKTEREIKLEQDVKNLASVIKSVETKLEVEGAALQEARFAHDVAKLRLKETEGSLGEERATGQQLAADIGELKQTVASLRCSLEEERGGASLLRERLESKELEYHSVEHQLRQQQAMTSDLSHQLQLSKSNMDALREELNLLKQRRSMMEEKYNGSLREIESLVDQFRLQITKEQQAPVEIKPAKTKAGGHRPQSGPGSLSQVPEKLRVTLIEFRALHESVKVQLGSTKSQLSNVRQNMKQLSTECSTYREIVTSRTTAMTEADKQLGESAQEMSKLTKQLAHYQAKCSSLKNELDALQQTFEQERNLHQNSQENLDSLTKTHRKDTENHCRFLSLLHEQLRLTTHSGPYGSGSDSELESGQSWPSTSTPLRQSAPSDWTSLSKSVSAVVLGLCEAFKRSKKENATLKSTATKLKSTLESTRALHKETTCKLTLNHEEQETQWTKRNEEMKANFEDLITEKENRASNLQQRLDDALQEVAQLTQSKLQVESQLKQLQETHRVYKNDRACLLSCTCLLAGALFPALQLLQELALQKAVLHKQMFELLKLRASVVEVSSSIQDHVGVHIGSPHHKDASDDKTNRPHPPSPLLRFRRVVVVVLAARRFQMIRSENSVLFRANVIGSRGHTFQIPVHLGIRDKRTIDTSPGAVVSESLTATNNFTSSHLNDAAKPSSRDLAGWMRSEKALLEVRESFTHLQRALDSCTTQQQKENQHQWQSKGRGLRKRGKGTKVSLGTTSVLRPARSAFEALLEKMGSHFPHAKKSSSSSIICSDSLLYLRLQPKSLCYCLAQGLHTILKNKPHTLHYYSKSSELGDKLHSQIINLVGHLHQAELQQRSLHSQLLQSNSNCESVCRQLHEAREVKANMESLQAELGLMIPRGQFEEVCKDLEASIKRERELKLYLSQHVTVAEKLQAKLQMASQNVQSKDSTLTQTKRELNDLRLSLQHKEHQLSAISKQLELVDREKLAQVKQLGELQTALAVCRKQMVHEVMSDSQTKQQDEVLDNQQLSSGNSFVALKQLHTKRDNLEYSVS